MSLERNTYSTVRRFLGFAIGQRIVDITQHDEDDFAAHGESFVVFQLEDGSTVQMFANKFGVDRPRQKRRTRSKS